MRSFIKSRLAFGVLALSLATLVGCDKNKPYDTEIPPAQVHFVGAAQQAYAVRAANVAPYIVKIGTTNVANSDRTVSVKVTSTTAVAGTQYTVPSTTVTIPAGEATGDFAIQGLFAGYPTDRVDTLVITLAEPSVAPAKFLDTVRLAIGDICVDGVGFVLSTAEGDYANTNETFGTSPYGPYLTSISSATSTGATTARIVVENIFDSGWGPISFDLDWGVTPLTATVVPQSAIPGSDGGSLNPAYAGLTMQVRAFSGTPGTFSTCDNTFTLRMQLGVTGLGWFNTLYTVNLAR